MPRYFFNFRQAGSVAPDEGGSEFDSVEAAYLAAFKAAQEMWHELLLARQDPRLCAFEVVDESGNGLFNLPFGEVLEVCAGRRGPGVLPTRPAVVVATIASRDEVSVTMRGVAKAMQNARTSLRDT